MLKFNVSAELKIAGKAGKFSGVLDRDRLEHLGREIVFATPVLVEAEYVYDGIGFSVTGSVQTKLLSECALCLKAFEEPFSFEFDEKFEKVASEDDGIYGFSGEELDLTRMILDNFYLNLPISSVCSESCKGLCPICGCDLNVSQCSCAREESDDATSNPFLVLEQLLREDKEV